MKKNLLLFATAALFTTAAYPVQPADAGEKVKIDFSAPGWKIPFKAKEKAEENKNSRKRTPSRADDATGFKAVVQSFQDYDYNFTTTCGEATVYDMTVSREGDKVIFKDLLTYDDYMQYYGYVSEEVEGIYDAQAGTVTVQTPYSSGGEATIVGRDDSYTYAIMAGNYDGYEFFPTEELVFDVIGDFEMLRSRQQIAVIEVYDDELGYLNNQFASLTMQPVGSPNALIVLPLEMDLGKCFPESSLKGTMQLVNLSDSEITYAVTAGAGSSGVSFEPSFGSVDTYYPEHVFVSYAATTPGFFDVAGTVAYETETDEKSVAVTFKGTVEDFPDYSAIVKEGNVSFATGYKLPFEIIDTDNGKAAKSGSRLFYEKSWLEARISVSDNHIGKFSYKGLAKCTDPNNVYAGHNAKIYVDGAEEPYFSTTEDADLDGMIEFNPGDHKIRFEYTVGSAYEPNPEYALTLNEVSFTEEGAKATGVDVLSPTIDFGGLLIENGKAEKTLDIKLRNTGSTPLRAVGFASTNPAYAALLPEEEAPLMGVLTIPVTLSANHAGKYDSQFTVSTNAGDVTVSATALVRELPDFSVILDDKEGIVTVSTDADHPFVICDDGNACNANAGVADNEPSRSVIAFTINVPDGKLAHIEWQAEQNASDGESTEVYINGPSGIGLQTVYGNKAFTQSIFSYDSRLLEMVPGTHTVEFTYAKNGDGSIEGKDCLSISRFAITLEDFNTKAASLDRNEVRFADCLLSPQGNNVNKTITTVNLRNDGSEELRVLYIDELPEWPDNTPFSFRDPGYVVRHGMDLIIDMVFFPQEEGKYEGEAEIPTTFGSYFVKCAGNAYYTDGMLLASDFDDTSGWTLIDGDKNGDNWFYVRDRFQFRPNAYCFSGENALMSYSKDGIPDNYAVSPEFDVPADGGMLTWWASPDSADAPTESYELSIIPADEYSEALLGTYPVAFAETLGADDLYYKQNTLDLKEWAGKKVRLVFRHNTASPQSALRIDDVFAYTNAKWGKITSSADSLISDKAVAEVSYFNMQGMRVDANASGVLVKRTVYTDGSVKVIKIVK